MARRVHEAQLGRHGAEAALVALEQYQPPRLLDRAKLPSRELRPRAAWELSVVPVLAVHAMPRIRKRWHGSSAVLAWNHVPADMVIMQVRVHDEVDGRGLDAERLQRRDQRRGLGICWD